MRRRELLVGLGMGSLSGCLRLQDPDSNTGNGGGATRAPSQDTELIRQEEIDFRAQDVRTVNSSIFLAWDTIARFDVDDSIQRLWEVEQISGRQMSVANDSLFVAPVTTGGESDPPVYAKVDPESGTAEWTYTGTYEGSFHVRPAIKNDTVVFPDSKIEGTDDGQIHALSTSDGSERWSVDPFTDNDTVIGGLTIVDDTCLVTSQSSYGDSHPVQYDLQTGEERQRLNTTFGDKVGLHEGMIIANSIDPNGVIAIDSSDQTEIWRWEMEPEINITLGEIGVHVWDETAFAVAKGSPGIIVLSADDGELQWSYETFNKVRRRPVRFGGLVWVIDMAGYLHGIDPNTGEGVVQHETNMNHDRTIATIPDGLVVPDGDVTSIYALDGQV